MRVWWCAVAALLPLTAAAPFPVRPHWTGWQAQAQPQGAGAGGVGTGRIFWSPLGDILEAIPGLPITLNVPDMMSAMWNYFSSWLPGGGGGGGDTADAGSRPPAKKKKKEALTRADLVDYFIYD